MNVYRGTPYQRGYGIGSFLGGLFRTVAPILRSGAKAVGKQVLRSGIGFLGDIAAGTTPPGHAADERFREFTGTLKRKADEKLERVLRGGGLKRRRVQRVTPQSLAKLLRVRTSKRTVRKKKQKKKVGRRKQRKRVTKKRKVKKTVKRLAIRRRRKVNIDSDIFG